MVLCRRVGGRMMLCRRVGSRMMLCRRGVAENLDDLLDLVDLIIEGQGRRRLVDLWCLRRRPLGSCRP